MKRAARLAARCEALGVLLVLVPGVGKGHGGERGDEDRAGDRENQEPAELGLEHDFLLIFVPWPGAVGELRGASQRRARASFAAATLHL